MIMRCQNALYDSLLRDWRKESFRTSTHKGRVVYEIIYMNYDRPTILHQYDFLGDGKTKRQMVTRKIDRFENKIQELPPYERHLLLQTLIAHSPREAEHFLSQIRRS